MEQAAKKVNRTSEDFIVQESSGNVLTDLGLAEPEEELAKAALVRRISMIIKQRHLTRQQAAELLGIDQPKVSALMRGRLAGFSTGRLLRFLNALDHDVEIVIKRKPRSRRRACLRVVTAS